MAPPPSARSLATVFTIVRQTVGIMTETIVVTNHCGGCRWRTGPRKCSLDWSIRTSASKAVRGVAPAATHCGINRACADGTTISDGRASGVHVSEQATAELFDSVVSGNKLCGVEIEGGVREGGVAALIARRNVLRGNGGDAVCAPQSAAAVLEGNEE